ncbi:MAG: DUF4124 domain-containing protein [Sinimarinibacterium sp.]|jgi:hypothetical protein
MDVKSTFLALLCAATVYGVHAGQVYKWVDPSGRVHFSDTPQQGWKLVDLNESPATSTTADAETDADAGAVAEGGDTDGAQTDTREQLRAEECKRAKTQLASYKGAAKIVERDALGKEKDYSSEERLQLLEQTQKRVTEMCGPDTQ